MLLLKKVVIAKPLKLMEYGLIACVVIILMVWTIFRKRRSARRFLHFSKVYGELLARHSLYFQWLDNTSQKKFLNRVIRFIAQKQFIPRNMKEVTDEMKVLIAASATQLTFGLPENKLRHFNKIIIYPDTYYSLINRSYHKGEVNPRVGAIVLSWKNFQEGNRHPHDSVNLGLHEMAHALSLTHKLSGNRILDPKWHKKWTAHAWWTIFQMKEGKNSIFRAYGSLNDEEFFAVAVEHFFERPEEFASKEPAMYRVLVALLRQDPLILQQKTAPQPKIS